MQGAVDSGLQFLVGLLFQLVDSLLIQNAFAKQEHLHARDRVASRVALTFNIRTIQPFVIRQRMRVGANHMSMDKCRTASGTAMLH